MAFSPSASACLWLILWIFHVFFLLGFLQHTHSLPPVTISPPDCPHTPPHSHDESPVVILIFTCPARSKTIPCDPIRVPSCPLCMLFPVSIHHYTHPQPYLSTHTHPCPSLTPLITHVFRVILGKFPRPYMNIHVI